MNAGAKRWVRATLAIAAIGLVVCVLPMSLLTLQGLSGAEAAVYVLVVFGLAGGLLLAAARLLIDDFPRASRAVLALLSLSLVLMGILLLAGSPGLMGEALAVLSLAAAFITGRRAVRLRGLHDTEDSEADAAITTTDTAGSFLQQLTLREM